MIFVMRRLTSQISPHDRFKGNDLSLLHEHRTSIELIFERPHFFRHLVDVGCYKMVRDDMCERREPEKRYFREELSFVWDTLYLDGLDRPLEK